MSINEDVMKMLKEKIGDMDITADTVISVLKLSMECAESTDLKGAEKKDLAIKLVRQVIVDAPISDEKEKLLLDMIDQNVLHNMIDLVVDATHGRLDVDTVVQVASGCCALLAKARK